MAQFKAFNAGVEVNGETVLSIVAGMGIFKENALQILSENGISNPQPGMWYSQQAWLNAFKTIAEKIGETTLYQIGRKIPENAQWPPDVNTIEKGLASIDVAYHMNHRLNNEVLYNPATGLMREGIGHYGFAKAGDRAVKMTCNNPYPCAFDLGIIDAVADKFAGKGELPKSKHEDPKTCRKTGADACIYTVAW